VTDTWTSHLPEIFRSLSSREYIIPPTYRLGTDAYLGPSTDRQDLIFSFPAQFTLSFLEEYSLPRSASAGAVHALIEHCKKMAVKHTELGLLYGAKTTNQSRYAANIEPCTIASSPQALASHLWRPDNENILLSDGVQLSIRGALPYLPLSPSSITTITDMIRCFLDAIATCLEHVPRRLLTHSWEAVLDQQHLRCELAAMNLVCFIGDGTRPARTYTRYRSWHRIAGPKDGVHVPFSCPPELTPLEITLAGTNQTITGLGIGRGEIIAITGSNAEGKSTLLQAISAGEDDHAPGDGREHLVTVPGGTCPDATASELKGADLRPFFEQIPPGMGGTPAAAFGQGSGSACMASRISDALRRSVPYIIIDEDRAAQNLMVPCYMSSCTVRSLAHLFAQDRRTCGETTFIIAGSGMELLIAQADRILMLQSHTPHAISGDTYRAGLHRHYLHMAQIIAEKLREPKY
jgi:predicted ABC-class ATPase